MPASLRASRPKGPSLLCVLTWSAKLQTDATLYWSPGSSSFPTLKWESLHLAHSNVIIVWFWWDPNAEAGSVMLAPSELHILFPLFLPINMTLDTHLATKAAGTGRWCHLPMSLCACKYLWSEQFVPFNPLLDRVGSKPLTVKNPQPSSSG